MESQLAVAGAEFDLKQRKLMAEAVLAGSAHTHVRQYRILLFADFALEEKFFGQLKSLAEDPDVWQLFPMDSFSVQFRSIAYRLLHRAGSSVFELIKKARDCFPTKLFRLLKDISLAQTFASTPCLKDNWTNGLQKVYPDLDHEDLHPILLAQAMLLEVDISNVEARHASVRRRLCSLSVQTWRLGLTQASFNWVLQQCHKRIVPQKPAASKTVAASTQ
eukprot:3355320-Amphidinium_carterae.1